LRDIEEVYAATLESINELIPWMPWSHKGYSIEETRKYVEEHAGGWQVGVAYEFAITDAKTGRYLGGCGINHVNASDNFANLGYWVRTSQTGKGIATTAALLLVKFGIEVLNLNRIEIVIAVENKASQRVAEKIRATREGILRNRLLLCDRVHDGVIFSIIPGDKIIVP
jgi:ribosomal-protein-serine acetyltransferase